MAILKVNGISKSNYFAYSGIGILEVESADKEFEFPDGSILENPYIDFGDNEIKTYIILGKVKSDQNKDEILSIDFAYGNIDFLKLKNDKDYRKRFFEYIVSRKGLDNIVKKICGALPIDVTIPSDLNDPKNKDWDKNINNYTCDLEKIKTIARCVIEKAHRVKRTVESVEEPEPVQIPKGFWNAFRTIEGSDIPKKKKKSILQVLQEIDEEKANERKERQEKKERKRRQARGEKVEDPIDYAEEIGLHKIKEEDAMITFYKTGAVVIKKPVFDKKGEKTGDYKTSIVSRYSLGYKEINKIGIEIQTILISDVDEKKLSVKGEYREKFVSDICLPILQYAKYGLPVEITQTWPYIGAFSSDDALSLKKNAINEEDDLQKYFSILSGNKKSKEPEK